MNKISIRQNTISQMLKTSANGYWPSLFVQMTERSDHYSANNPVTVSNSICGKFYNGDRGEVLGDRCKA